MSHQPIKQPFVLPSGGQANGSSNPESTFYLKNLGVQISGTFTATVTIEGRVDASLSFDTLATFTSQGGIFPIPNDMPLAQLRITVSGHSSGTIAAYLAGRTAQA